MNKTSFELGHETGMERGIERGMERGMERGRNQGHRELVIAVLEGRFGPLSEEALSKIEQLSDLRILQLARDTSARLSHLPIWDSFDLTL